MLSVLVKSVFTFLIIYALMDIFHKIFLGIFSVDENKKDIFLFIHVKNQEETIEYIIRCTLFNYLHRYGGREVPYIVIVDNGSEDKTAIISQKLCEDYDFVYYTTYDEYCEFKKEIGR